jgi:ATP-dependent Zn protease
VTSTAASETATAYHEAGHAVAAWLRGMKFREVSILPNASANSLGHLLHAGEPRWFHPEYDVSLRTVARVENHILVCFAGPAAEARLRGRHNWRGAGSDMQQAADMVSFLCGSAEEEEAYLKLVRIRARGLVEAHWVKVEAIAMALMDRRRLTWVEVDTIIRGRLPRAIRLTAS